MISKGLQQGLKIYYLNSSLPFVCVGHFPAQVFKLINNLSAQKWKPFTGLFACTCNNVINSPFLFLRFLFQVFAKNSLIKNIFQEEKKFDSGT